MNQKIEIIIDAQTGKRKLRIIRDNNMPQANPDDFAYELDLDDIERSIESPFYVYEDKLGWRFGRHDNPESPQFMIAYEIGLSEDTFHEILQEEFGAEIIPGDREPFFREKEQTEAAMEWMEAMLVMAAMGADD